ncbi:MAG: c-type cytochrome [Gammaproteobacteria bacterium]|uniref:c-type cytochrome n=1 Tax=Azohydromonas sp. TaxID=1872666 RepID=UPI002BE75447|nr:cytochrome C [Azohydromonas sp.]HMM86114.1 cytochrome C [Azohydromonas sp.]
MTDTRATPPRMARATAALLLLAATASAALAATPDEQRLRTRALAATCAHCHGTDGRAVEGEAMIRLAGRDYDDLLRQLTAFRSGQRYATIMHQITRGYSPEQLEAVARYFSEVKEAAR